VTGSTSDAEIFAAAWQRRTGGAFQVRQRQRLYRLDELVPPEPRPPGAPRVAGAADRDLLLTWYEAFTRETDAMPGRSGVAIDDRLGYGGLTLWEVDGIPVSMAGQTRLVAGMVRVAPVYTPPEHRRRGFAAAVTATVSQAGLDAGAGEVLLFTDLANPTSNSVYQRIGYRPVDDFLVVAFGPSDISDISDGDHRGSHLRDEYDLARGGAGLERGVRRRGEGTGEGGVREPRRPKPSPPALSAEELPPEPPIVAADRTIPPPGEVTSVDAEPSGV
jgi:GNAT superfamily N-acetyltransferase